MGTIFKDAAGRIGYRRDDEETSFPLPEGAAEIVEVDFEANSDVLEALNRDINRFRLERGVLYQADTPVVFDQETERRALRRAAAALNGKRIADLTAAEFRLLVTLLAMHAGWLSQAGTLRF